MPTTRKNNNHKLKFINDHGNGNGICNGTTKQEKQKQQQQQQQQQYQTLTHLVSSSSPRRNEVLKILSRMKEI